ncbi:unnamed protein product, partial [Staurois parvus]
MTAGTGSPGIRSFGLPAGTASSGKAVWARVTRHWIVWLDSGHRVTRYDSGHWVTRHQVIWLARGHPRLIWQGSGHRVNWHDSGHRIRYRIIWINSGHRVTGLIGSSGWISSSGLSGGIRLS